MENTTSRVVLQNVRLSYAHIWAPSEDLNGNPKYSVCLLIPKTDKANLSRIKAGVAAAKNDGKPKLADKNGSIPANLDTSVRDGDTEKAGQEEYAGCYYINAKANPDHAPKIVDHACAPIMDKDQVYSGCYAHVSINFFAYNKNGKKGIAAGLGNIMKVKDGERFAGGASAEDDFKDLKEDTSADDFLG